MVNSRPAAALTPRTRSAPRRSAAAQPTPATKAKERIAVNLPFLGTVPLPHPEQLAYYLGIGALVALEVVEWPAALVLGLGHAMITQQHNQAMHDFAQALEDVERA